jgi:membrane fusion protein, macrolide-specific efflux system
MRKEKHWNMFNKKINIILAVVLAVIIAVVFIVISKRGTPDGEIVKEIQPIKGPIQKSISTTGTVLPKNRLEIKPPVSGRVESVLVKEGEHVIVGQTLAWISSTERAALLDAAREQDAEKVKYWQEVYKPIALIAPIDGDVIVATTQPGQTVTSSDAVIVLSDQLIVRAQVDETDIGKIKLNQQAVITLDAYSDTKIEAKVEHIYYESQTLNNVTIYKVDLVPVETPEFFRSGMNAAIEFIVEERRNAILVPVEAVQSDGDGYFVLLKHNGDKNPLKRPVRLGKTDEKNYEVLSGITAADTIVVTTKKYVFPSSDNTGSNPFLPKRFGQGQGRR